MVPKAGLMSNPRLVLLERQSLRRFRRTSPTHGRVRAVAPAPCESEIRSDRGSDCRVVPPDSRNRWSGWKGKARRLFPITPASLQSVVLLPWCHTILGIGGPTGMGWPIGGPTTPASMQIVVLLTVLRKLVANRAEEAGWWP